MEQRGSMRVACRLAASVGGPGRERLHGWVRNLSGGGLFVETAGSMPVGTRCEIALLIQDGEVERASHAVGHVVRVEADGLAIRIVAMHADAQRLIYGLLAAGPAPTAG